MKVPNIAHLSILTSVGYNKKKTNLKNAFYKCQIFVLDSVVVKTQNCSACMEAS